MDENLKGAEYDGKTAPEVTENLVKLIRDKVKSGILLTSYILR